MADQHTLRETERAVAQRLDGLPIDGAAMAGVSNVHRAAAALRNHFEHTVLAPYELTWTAWLVLWVVWVRGDIENRYVTAEAGISKGSLTGVVATLSSRGLLDRRIHPDDRRRILLSLTPAGRRLMTTLLPAFNEQESAVVQALTAKELKVLTNALRKVVLTIEAQDAAPDPLVPAVATSRRGPKRKPVGPG